MFVNREVIGLKKLSRRLVVFNFAINLIIVLYLVLVIDIKHPM